MMRLRPGVARALVGGAAISAVAAGAIAASGGIGFRVAGVAVRAHDPARPLILAALLAALASAAGRSAVGDALGWWWAAIERRAAAVALGASLAALGAGFAWNTYVAGGSDSYCYLNQAELFARGDVRDFEPLATDVAWPGTIWAFVPAGHMPYAPVRGAIVPICPAGYPLMMAAARTVFGRAAMFAITPISAGLLVWCAFLLGRRLHGPAAGLLAALLTAASPTMMMQAVQPMNDVPAAMFWVLALVLAAGRIDRTAGLRGAALSGLASGAALTIRPNLVPLAAVIGLGILLLPRAANLRDRLVSGLAYGCAAVPGVLVVLAVQAAMYGAPLSSGYGDLSALFSLSHIAPNAPRYASWLIDAHTPAILAGLAAPFVVARRREAWWLLAFVAVTIGCYLPYVVFDAWWYTRFLLPGIPVLLVLTAPVTVRLIEILPRPARPVLFTGVAAGLAILLLRFGAAHDVFNMRALEWRFRSAGEYIARALPAEAAIVTVHQSGSVRFYSGRSAVAWSDIDAGRLDEALAFLRRHGRKPYLVFEPWEEAPFRARFAGERLGALDWPPMAVVDGVTRVYDPDQAR